MKKKHIIGLILARKGSKRLKNKNLRQIYKNKNLINSTILFSKKLKFLKKTILSSDDQRIIRVCKKEGILSPGLRPKSLSGDKTKSEVVAKYAVKWYEKKFGKVDGILLLQPTTPLKNAKMIDDGIKKIVKEKGSSLVSVYEVDDNHPARMYKIKSKKLIPISKKNQQKNRQKLEKIYHRDGNLYIFSCKNFINKKIKNYYGNKIVPLVLSKNYKLNIDTYLDLELAKVLIK